MVNRKELNPDASPQAAFGVRIRSSREARGWTQDALSVRMGVSSGHISGVETTRKSPSVQFAKAADQAFGTAGSAATFERQWREMHTGSLLEGFPEYLGHEARAVEIRLFEIGIIPGLLQTPAYARALADGDVRRGTITPDQAAERVSVLADRQATLKKPRPATMLVVMDESCIRRSVGGAQVMREQLQHILKFAGSPNTTFQIAPYDIGELRPFNLPINLLTQTDRSVIAYSESQIQGHLERESSFVLAALSAYHQLQAESLSQTKSVDMVHQARKGTP
ncbi:helix-turn-helix domain-containing protein [Streptomyces uncialis]|uniref:helix-turn-helix domain-containing protein n=1 Tax=Streptomyces uncialis TaxID=1048205 RepID=UPI0037AA8593